MQGNLISFARRNLRIVDNPPMLAHPWAPLRFHSFLDLIHRQMRGRSGDSMPHVGSSFPSICVFSSSLLFYHIEGELVLAQAVSDASFFEVQRQLLYKIEQYGGDVQLVSRWYP